MVFPLSTKVTYQTAQQIGRRIRRKADCNITYYAARPQELDERLRELKDEWDVQRILESGESAASLMGLVLGYAQSPRWFLLPLAIQGFILQHAFVGRAPRLPFVPYLGFRTRREVDHERHALEALRGGIRRVHVPVTTALGVPRRDVPLMVHPGFGHGALMRSVVPVTGMQSAIRAVIQ